MEKENGEIKHMIESLVFPDGYTVTAKTEYGRRLKARSLCIFSCINCPRAPYVHMKFFTILVLARSQVNEKKACLCLKSLKEKL